jgi:AcrR family transcriptional regulator
MSSVSADPTGRKPYHHGALHSALIEASIALAREGGPDRVILREAARAAGVSHSAAYRHFADREALLAEVSRFARNELGAEMRRRVNRTRDPRRRLRAVGTAYIDFALTEPGLFRTAFTGPGLTAKDAHHPPTAGMNESEEQLGPFELLQRQTEQLVQAAGLPPRARRYASLVAWAAMHGLSMLALDGQLDRLSDRQRNELVDRLVRMVDAGLLVS